MSVDLIIVGAIIQNKTMIDKAINSCPVYDYNNKFICLDGCPKNKDNIEYQEYITNLKENYKDYTFICFDENIYFREMIKSIALKSQADKLLVIQDDVIVNYMNLGALVDDMNSIKDMKVLCFWHRPIDNEFSHHWLDIIETNGDYVKSHGWTERVFLCDKLAILNMCNYDNPTKNTKRFLEAIYHREKNLVSWKQSNEEYKLDYWKSMGTYIHRNITHKHQVGKR